MPRHPSFLLKNKNNNSGLLKNLLLVCKSISSNHPCIYLSIHLSDYTSINLPIYTPIHLYINLTIHQSIDPFFHLSLSLSLLHCRLHFLLAFLIQSVSQSACMIIILMVVISVIKYPLLKDFRKILNINSSHFISDHSALVTIIIDGFNTAIYGWESSR